MNIKEFIKKRQAKTRGVTCEKFDSTSIFIGLSRRNSGTTCWFLFKDRRKTIEQGNNIKLLLNMSCT